MWLGIVWGDNDCDTDIDAVDALAALRNVARLSPVHQTEPCPSPGSTVAVAGGSEHPWADVQCTGEVDAVDALAILRHVAALSLLTPVRPCPDIGDSVQVAEP